MTFEPENPMEEALMRAESPAARREFYRLLLTSDVLVVGRKAEDGRLQIVTSERDGQKYVTVFTSQTRLKNHVQKTVNTLTMNGRLLLERTRGVTLLFNLSDEYGGEIKPAEVERILGESPFKIALN
jgi:hypothetical protein